MFLKKSLISRLYKKLIALMEKQHSGAGGQQLGYGLVGPGFESL
jgi:hypothetical protein